GVISPADWGNVPRAGAHAPPPGHGDRARRARTRRGTAVYVACSTLCFSKLPLEDALHTIREMQFQKADLAIHDPGPHLTPAEVAADLGRVPTRLKAAHLPLAAFEL